jgi:DNA polymerase-3 subunit epsilon
MNILNLLPLDRPLIWFDCETTGPNPAADRIVELGFVRVQPSGERYEWSSFINPQMPIPHEATFGNGDNYPGHRITDAMVQGCRKCGQQKIEHDQYEAGLNPHCSEGFHPWPTFAQLAESLLRGFQACDYAGYGIKNFDLPLMAAEFTRTGHPQWSYDDARILDGLRIWQLGVPRSLSDAVEQFLSRKHEGAHRVLDDVHATMEVIPAQLERFVGLPRDLQRLHDLEYPRDPNAIDPEGKLIWHEGEATMNFGKNWKGLPLRRMKQRDLVWISSPQCSAAGPTVKRICSDAAKGIYPTKDKLPL